VSLGSVAVAGLLAAAPPPANPAGDEFVQSIRPVLAQKCRTNLYKITG